MKKILVLAFVSAAFLFSCSADYELPITSSNSPPEWSGGPASTPSTPGGGGGGKYCVTSDYDYYDGYEYCDCYDMNSYGISEDECYYYDGDVRSSCPSNCDIHR